MSQVTISAADIKAMGGLEVLQRKLEGPALVAEAEASMPRRRKAAPGSKAEREQRAKGATEHDYQVEFIKKCQAAEAEYPLLKYMYAVPNGGHRYKLTAVKLRAEGVRSGVLDIDWPVPLHGWHGWKLEFKRPGGTIKESQWRFYTAMTMQGYKCCFAWSVEEAWQHLMDYINGTCPRGI